MGLFLNIHSGQQSPKSAMTGEGVCLATRKETWLSICHMDSWHCRDPTNMKGEKCRLLAWHRSPPDRFCLVGELLRRKESVLLFLSNIGYLYQVDKIGVVIYIFVLAHLLLRIQCFSSMFSFFLIIFCILEISAPLICYIGCTFSLHFSFVLKFCSGQIICHADILNFHVIRSVVLLELLGVILCLERPFLSQRDKILILPGSLLLILCESLGI